MHAIGRVRSTCCRARTDLSGMGPAEEQVEAAVGGKGKRIVMQYSPNNDIPYISRVDAGTIEMVRSCGHQYRN